MPQTGNAVANRRAQGKPSARSAPATSKPSPAPAKAPAAKTRTAKPASAKPAKTHPGNGAAEASAKLKPAVPNAARKARKDAEKKDKMDQKKSKKLLKRLEKAAKGDKIKDKAKAKKKSHSSGRVNAEIDYESRMNRDEAVAYFDALVAGLKQGSVRFKQGEETVVIRPSELVDVEIKARSSGRKEKVRFEISWLSEYSGKMSITSD